MNIVAHLVASPLYKKVLRGHALTSGRADVGSAAEADRSSSCVPGPGRPIAQARMLGSHETFNLDKFLPVRAVHMQSATVDRPTVQSQPSPDNESLQLGN